jgi:hypothetical protein
MTGRPESNPKGSVFRSSVTRDGSDLRGRARSPIQRKISILAREGEGVVGADEDLVVGETVEAGPQQARCFPYPGFRLSG